MPESKPEPYPECTCAEGNQGTAEAWLFTLGGDTLVDTLPKPNVRVDIPGIQENLEVRGYFNL